MLCVAVLNDCGQFSGAGHRSRPGGASAPGNRVRRAARSRLSSVVWESRIDRILGENFVAFARGIGAEV